MNQVRPADPRNALCEMIGAVESGDDSKLEYSSLRKFVRSVSLAGVGVDGVRRVNKVADACICVVINPRGVGWRSVIGNV